MAEKLTMLFQCMWRKEAIPQDFKDAYHNPPIQTERKSSSLRQPQRYLSLIICLEDTGRLDLYQKVSVGSGKIEGQ